MLKNVGVIRHTEKEAGAYYKYMYVLLEAFFWYSVYIFWGPLDASSGLNIDDAKWFW